MRLAIAVALVGASCASDPTLNVTVTHPQGLPIASTTITVYESQTLTCDDVEFAQLSSDQLGALQVAEETIDALGHTTGALTGISRTDHKVVVARGLDSGGKLLAAGCAEHDVVDGTVELAITTVPAVTPSIVPPDPTSMDPTMAQVGAIDPSGMLLDGRAVSWTVYGPAGSTPLRDGGVTVTEDGTWEPAAPSCTSSGLLKVHPVAPGVVGGYAVQIRVGWATALPAMYTSLSASGLALMPFTPPAGSTRFCAIRTSGVTSRLVCLDGSGTGVIARDYQVNVAGGAATLVEQQNQVTNPEAIAIVAVPSGSDRLVYAVTIRGRLEALFGAPAADNSQQYCAPTVTCTYPVDDAIVLPSCGNVPARILMHTSAPAAGQLVEIPAQGGMPATYPLPPSTVGDTTAELDRAGCVTAYGAASTPALRQVTSIHMGRRILGDFVAANTFASYGCTGSASVACTTVPLVPGAGVGFTTGSEPRMIVTSIDATGVVVLQIVMAADVAGRDHFVERARVPAASLPEHVVIGQFDTDSTTDLLWSISGKRGATTSLEVAYSRLAIDQPLEALSPAAAATLDDILAGDLTGDGKDDLVLTGAGAAGTTGLAVVAMDVPTASAVPPADPTCAP